jgi:Ala-tRNA(Pro) deacylase
MAVLPAHREVDLEALRRALNAQVVNLASEEELEVLYPDCEPGAMPPFGSLYHMPVYLSADLSSSETITFNAGTHVEAIRMAYQDFLRLAQPQMLSFSKVQHA